MCEKEFDAKKVINDILEANPDYKTFDEVRSEYFKAAAEALGFPALKEPTKGRL